MTNKRKIEILKDIKDVVKIALAGVIVGGIIREEYLKNNIFVWVITITLLVTLFSLKTEE